MTLALSRTRSRHRQRYYGVTTMTDGLWNFTMDNIAYAIRDRCYHSGVLNSISMYCQTGSGYSLGTGGSIQCRVETDDGTGFPTGTLVSAGANVTLVTPNASAIRTWAFNTPPTLVSGNVYHYVFTNQDASPAANFVSLNSNDINDLASAPQPTVPDSYRMTLVQITNPTWIVGNFKYYPIFRLLFADGFKAGHCYYEFATPMQQIGGNNKVRLNFTPTTTVTVKAAHLRVSKVSGTAAVLVANLRNLTAATLLDTTSFTAASVHLGDGTYYGSRYVDWTLSAPVTLNAGTNYAVELTSTEATNKYRVGITRRGGTDFGLLLDSLERFTDGQGEISTDGTTWSTLSGEPEYLPQIYFDQA